MFENFKHIRALCCQFKYMTFNWRQNQTFKATYTSAVHNWTPKDCVAEDCNIKNNVWGKAPAKFWELCLRMLSKLKHFLLWCLTFNVVKIEHLRLLKQYMYMYIWRWRYMGQSTMWLRNAISRLGFGAKPQRNVEYLLAILSI
jgi:hypothetical protein